MKVRNTGNNTQLQTGWNNSWFNLSVEIVCGVGSAHIAYLWYSKIWWEYKYCSWRFRIFCGNIGIMTLWWLLAGDFAYLPKMQLMNLGGVLLALWLTFRNNWGLGGIWWCLVFYFGFRAVYHSLYISFHWKTHVSFCNCFWNICWWFRFLLHQSH